MATVRIPVDLDTLCIVTRSAVRSDAFPGERGMVVRPSEPVRCRLNPYGAVSALAHDGRWLGIKPREFDFVCPIAKGRTYLDSTWRIDVEPGQKHEGLTIASVVLARLDESPGWEWFVEVVEQPAAISDYNLTFSQRMGLERDLGEMMKPGASVVALVDALEQAAEAFGREQGVALHLKIATTMTKMRAVYTAKSALLAAIAAVPGEVTARARRSWYDLDAETRDHLADLKRQKRGMGGAQVRARREAAAQAEADAWNAAYPIGTIVDRRDDVGALHRTRTRSIAWVICGHASVMVDGISGGYLLERMTPIATTTTPATSAAEGT